MKHLLIIISILLLSSPVIGDNHKGETLYVWYEGDWVYGEDRDYKWMGFGDKDTHPKYQGQVKDGKPNGLGILIYPNLIIPKYLSGTKYIGSWKDGKQNGQGTLSFPDGDKYEGKFKDGEYHGQGTWTMSNGVKYVGEWKYHKKHGQGTQTSPDGRKYVGGFKDGKPWTGIGYDKYGTILYKFVNGEPQ